MRGSVNRRKLRWLSPTLLVLLFLALALLAMAYTGVFTSLGFGSAQVSHAGMVAIPISGTMIPAYTKISRDNLTDPKTRGLSVLYVRPQDVTPDMLRTFNGILGRVLNHDKLAGYVFSDSDFFPPGTRPGLVAGIPAGKRAMRMDISKLNGMVGLGPGDRFDMVATLPIDKSVGNSLKMGSGIYGNQLDLQARLLNWQRQATVKVLVQNGVIVEPVTTRQIPVFSNTLTQGGVTRMKPVQEVVVAIDPAEIAHLAEALAVEADITCLPRSGRPNDPLDSRTPELRPWSPYLGLGAAAADAASGAGTPVVTPAGTQSITSVETISGTKREIVGVPRRN